MSNLEHLIENTLSVMNNGVRGEELVRVLENDPNIKYAGITVEQCIEICSYILYTYIPYNLDFVLNRF